MTLRDVNNRAFIRNCRRQRGYHLWPVWYLPNANTTEKNYYGCAKKWQALQKKNGFSSLHNLTVKILLEARTYSWNATWQE